MREALASMVAVCLVLWSPSSLQAAPGDLDVTFGVGGTTTTPGTGSCKAVTLQPDGKILAVGYGSLYYEGVKVVRYFPDGTLDPTFGTAGIATTYL